MPRVSSVRRSWRLPVALVTAVVVAQAAVVLMRPRDRGPDPLPVDARAYFSEAQIEKAVDYRTGQWRLTDPVELTDLTQARNRAPRISGAGAYVRTVKAIKTKSAGDKDVERNVKAIQAAMKKLSDEWAAIEKGWRRWSLNEKLTKIREFNATPLYALYMAVHTAYKEEAHEKESEASRFVEVARDAQTTRHEHRRLREADP